uniref:Uncharacterized protein n=1 Tax=Ixodes ricinus TaxID=34613 RepID=A0A6B0U4R4_IXORI
MTRPLSWRNWTWTCATSTTRCGACCSPSPSWATSGTWSGTARTFGGPCWLCCSSLLSPFMDSFPWFRGSLQCGSSVH